MSAIPSLTLHEYYTTLHSEGQTILFDVKWLSKQAKQKSVVWCSVEVDTTRHITP